MKYVVVVAALVLVLAAQALVRADAPTGVQKWEYRLVAIVGAGAVSNPLFDAFVGTEGKSMTKALEGVLA